MRNYRGLAECHKVGLKAGNADSGCFVATGREMSKTNLLVANATDIGVRRNCFVAEKEKFLKNLIDRIILEDQIQNRLSNLWIAGANATFGDQFGFSLSPVGLTELGEFVAKGLHVAISKAKDCRFIEPAIEMR